MKWSPDIYAKAWNFATVAHEGQTYGSAEKNKRVTYLNHIGSVATEVMWGLQACENYNADLALQCALLHDVVEDTKYTYEDVKYFFGESVATGVLALTKDETLGSKKAQMQDSLERILQQPHEVWMVKLADRISNLATIPHYWTEEKIAYYKEEAFYIHRLLKESNSFLSERLLIKIEEYNR